MNIWSSIFCRKYFEKHLKKIFLRKMAFSPIYDVIKVRKLLIFGVFPKNLHLNLILAPKFICWLYKLDLIFCKISWRFQKWYLKCFYIKLWHHDDVICIDVFCDFWPFLHKISFYEPMNLHSITFFSVLWWFWLIFIV